MAFLLPCITDIFFFRLESCFKDCQFKEMASLRGLYFHITSAPFYFLSKTLGNPLPTKVTFDTNQKRLTILKISFECFTVYINFY